MKKKYLLVFVGLLLASCTSKEYQQIITAVNSDNPKAVLRNIAKQKGQQYAENPNLLVNDIKRIENISKAFADLRESVIRKWGERDAKEPSAKEYVKYTNNYQSRAIIDYEKGLINIGTIDSKNINKSLKEAIVMTLLMPNDPSSADLFNTNSIKLGGEPYLYGEVVDNEGQPIRWQWRANKFADYLLQNSVKTYQLANNKVAYYVQIPLIKHHEDVRAHKYQALVTKYAKQYQVDAKLIYAIIKTESDFNQYAVSRSGAIGLMQIMPNTAGTDAYAAIYNKKGKPSREYLFDPANNIQMGTVYIDILKNRYLKAITNQMSKEYCVISAYNGGAGTVLSTFHKDRNKAMSIINTRTPSEIYHTLTTQVSSKETRDYLKKVTNNKKLF